MLKLTTLVALATLALSGCNQAQENLSIAAAEDAGFEKNQQQIFQMVGAKDGWSGEWAGEIVELYEYSEPSAINRDAFEASIQPGNLSGWVEMCAVRNMLMLSKGDNACRHLEALAD